MSFQINVVGIGPGSKEYILPVAQKYIDNAKVLLGGRRALADYAKEGQETFPIMNNIDEVIRYIKDKLTDSDVVVMVSGDPGFHSLLVRLKKEFPIEQITVLPGICSLQMAFAKIGEYWQDAGFLSMHGECADTVELRYSKGRKLGLLTDYTNTPKIIFSLLLNLGWPKTARAYILSDLSYPSEQIISGSLEELAQSQISKNCVVIVCDK